MLQAKSCRPLKLVLGDGANYICKDEYFENDIPLDVGIMIGSEHFGFDIYTKGVNGDLRLKRYMTHGNVREIGMVNGNVVIYEEFKSIPWQISQDGTIVSKAGFSLTAKEDFEYLSKIHGIKDTEEIEAINNEELEFD